LDAAEDLPLFKVAQRPPDEVWTRTEMERQRLD
jgi:hypothetical protein